MNPTVLNFVRLPARLDSQAAATFLGIPEHSLPILAKRKLLVPLGKNLAPNAPKYYATCQLEELAKDKEWLDRVCSVLTEYWRDKNQRRVNDRRTGLVLRQNSP